MMVELNEQTLVDVSTKMWELKQNYPVSYIVALYLIELGISPDECTEEELLMLAKAVENCSDDSILSEEVIELLNTKQ